MSSKIERTPIAPPPERTAPLPGRSTQETRTQGWFSIEWIGLATAAAATVVIYMLFLLYPVAHEPLDQFLTTVFGRGNAAIWPMQLVWYACAVAIVGLAMWPIRRASQLVSLLCAAYLVWMGIVFFGVIDSGGVGMAWLWSAAFVLEGVLFLVAGIARRDLAFAPSRTLSWVLGAVFIAYSLVAYPIVGLLSGHPLSILPMIGLAPCPTVLFFFGLLLWVRPPVPKYLLVIPLAWALQAAPGNLAMSHVADFPLILFGAITAGLIIWRDRTVVWQTVVAGLLLAWMIAWSGQTIELLGTALLLVVVTLVQTIRSDAQQLHGGRTPQHGRALTT